MSVLWKKIALYKGKSCNRNRNWGLRQRPGGVSGSKALIFDFLMPLRQLNGLQCHYLAILYSHGGTPRHIPGKQVCNKQSTGTSMILLQYLFQFQNKAPRLNCSAK